MTLGWYLRRFRSMGAPEVAWRVRTMLVQSRWRVRAGARWPVPRAEPRWAGGQLPLGTGIEAEGAEAVLAAAQALLEQGRWPVFTAEANLSGLEPDWFHDPATGKRAPASEYCFTVPHRDQRRVGNVKYVWEVSRLQHLTVLAAAYHLSGDVRFAERALAHLQSWWRANLPLRGIHWVSGIELGLRLLTWTWVRRLLARWPGVAACFEADPLFQRQLHAHQAWIATFYSRGTSANNHLVAEMAGLLAASRAFPIFAESDGWSRLAAAHLEREAERQTFPDGLNRELAGDYHCFVTELFLISGIEADIAGPPMSAAYWEAVKRMLTALAATVDVAGNGSRQGDGDDGRALLFTTPGKGTGTVLEAGGRLMGRPDWWPAATGDVGAALLASMGAEHRIDLPGPEARPSLFPDAGVSILRDLTPRPADVGPADVGPAEMWCRFDHGPHGFLRTAAHAHADALSFELRFGGREILVDPGTYCYHGERAWRTYFRSTIGHNTLQLAGRDQAEQAGPFLWRTRPEAELFSAFGLTSGPVACVEATHDGYRRTKPWMAHRRKLALNRAARSLEVIDSLDGDGSVDVRLAFHLHPSVDCRLEGARARLAWAAAEGPGEATIDLAPGLAWSAHRGETDPIMGWYSRQFGEREPTTALVGRGRIGAGEILRSRIVFVEAAGLCPSNRRGRKKPFSGPALTSA